jgi:hypothetical protein
MGIGGAFLGEKAALAKIGPKWAQKADLEGF